MKVVTQNMPFLEDPGLDYKRSALYLNMPGSFCLFDPLDHRHLVVNAASLLLDVSVQASEGLGPLLST